MIKAITTAIVACAVMTAPGCGKQAATSEARLAALVAAGVPPVVDHVTMPDAERTRLQALAQRDPKQILALDQPALEPADYTALAGFHGNTILLLGVTALSPADAAALAAWPGISLHLPQLAHLDAATATALASWHGQTLGIGRAQVDPDAAERLAAFKGAVAIALDHPHVAAVGAPPPATSEADLATLGRISKAIDAGDVEAVRAFLVAGGAVDMNERGTTLLMEAANLKQVAVAKLLIDAHANVNAVNQDGLTPLYYALDDFSRAPNDTGTNVADLVRLLVEAGADLTTPGTGSMWKPPLAQASARGDQQLVAYLMSKSPRPPASAHAIDPAKQQALIDAITNGDSGMTKKLLASGATLTPPSPAMGMSPIHQAVEQGSMAISMARYDKKDAAPLVAKWLAMLDVVLGAGTDLSARSSDGWTSLDSAINGGVIEIVTRVLDAKPDLAAVDGKGLTPLQFLASNHRLEEKDLVPIANLLRARGAAADSKAAAIATDRKLTALAAVLQ